MRRLLLIGIVTLAAVYSFPAFADSVGDLMAQGDALFIQRTNRSKALKAAEFYEKALKADENNYMAAWKLAYAHFFIGEELSRGDQIINHYRKSVEAAERAIAIKPAGVEGVCIRGVATASILSVTSNVLLVSAVQADMRKTIGLKPGYKGGSAYRVLGRLYQRLPAILGGSDDKSEKNYLKAISIAPKYWQNQLYLADLYAAQDKNEKAKKLLNQVLTGKAPKDMGPEHHFWKKQATELLKKIKASEAGKPAKSE